MKKAILILIPLALAPILSSCKGTVKKCTVTFESNGGTSVASQTVYYNETVYEPTKPTKTSSTEFTFQFEEWQLNGAKFDFNTPITKNITLEAKWKENKRKYTVTFDSNGGFPEVEPQIIEYSEEARVSYPGAISRPTSSMYRYVFNGWHEVVDGEMETAAFKFEEEPVDHDILLKVKWGITPNLYSANATDTDNLKFLKNGKSLTNITATAGQPFTFEMKTTNSEYNVPSSLQISIGGKPVLVKGYTVNIDQKDPTKATVTIDANKLVGAIKIVGDAVRAGNFVYEVPYHYGLKSITSDTHDLVNPLTISFAKESVNYGFPKPESVYVQFDNCEGTEKVQWVSPAEDESYVKEYCSYNPDNGQLTIKPKHINNHIKIIARADGYNLLNTLKWNDGDELDINDASETGLAPYLFYLGEKKTVKVNGKDHQVRIIGFNHDVDQNNNRVGITFEFAGLIKYGDKFATSSWEDKSDFYSTNYNFVHSDLNNFLNSGSGCVFYNIEEDLRSVIKTVNKKVGLQESYTTDLPYTTKLFPLSYEEIGGTGTDYAHGEGEVYDYFKDIDYEELKARRTKGGGYDDQYWLRSPKTNSNNGAWCVTYTGDLDYLVIGARQTVSPAFCV